jgi:hypothetical protein
MRIAYISSSTCQQTQPPPIAALECARI